MPLLINEINNWINGQIESRPKKEIAVVKVSRFNGLEKVVKSLLKKGKINVAYVHNVVGEYISFFPYSIT